MSAWFCLNCEAVRDLDIHGRCENCGSDAVTVASLDRPFQRPDQKPEFYGGNVLAALCERGK